MAWVRRLLKQYLSAISRGARGRRMEECVRLLRIDAGTRVLDVGGTPDIWRLAPVMPRLTVLNHPRAEREALSEVPREVPVVFGDGRALPFADKSFDVVFSNSVIEHVGSAADQARFAAEIARVGKTYWVETPNRYFFAEQHLWMPFAHWLPKRWQAACVRRISAWEWVVRPAADERDFYFEHYLKDVGLLSTRKLRSLFPGARIRRERFLGWTKSLIALCATPAARRQP